MILALAALSTHTSTARASCGDYLHVGTSAAANGAERLTGPSAEHGAIQGERERGPCRGPNCSKRPVQPPFIPAAPAPAPTADVATLGVDAGPPGPGEALLTALIDRAIPIAAPFRLERPPRG